MDIFDVYEAFCPQKMLSDERASENESTRKLTRYEFGTVIEVEGVPSYKIEKGGKITIYQTLIDRKTKKETVYDSKFVLVKI